MPSLSDYQAADAAAREHALALEDALAAKLRPLIKRLVARAMRNLSTKTRVLTAAGGDWTQPDSDELMNRHALDQELEALLASFQSKAVKRVVNGIATELGVSLDLKNPLMQGVLAGRGQKITHISESLRADVMTQIEDAWERGLSIADTVALITEHATEFSASRAATIARTEIIGTSNQASLAAVRMTGAAATKTWLATNDPQTRPDHADANGQTVPIDEPFDVGGYPMDAPGDPTGPAEEVINCRCTVVYGDSSEGPDLSGLGASGGRMTEDTSTLARMVVSIEGVDYTLPQPLTEAGLRRLNPEITDDHLDALLRLSLTAAATGDTSLPLGARDESWDASAAEGAMDGAAQLAAMHFWQDPEGDPEAKASYKLPFATPDPDPHAVWAACTACAASMMGARGGVDIPDADMPGVKAKIEAMYKKAATKYNDDTITPPWMDGMNAATEPPAQPAPAGSIGEWTADPLIPYGVATRDGRMIRAASLTWSDQLPIPLMAMLEEVHGQSMDLPASVLAGAMVSFDDSPARLAASGTFDDSDGGRAAMAAVQDGRMGISADLAVTEYEYVMSQAAIDEMNQMMDEMEQEMNGEAPAKMDMPPSQDVEGGVVVESGDQTDMGMFVVTAGEVMGATIVPFAAFDSARIELTSLAADGHPTHAHVVMPLRAVSVVEPAAPDDPSSDPREGVTGPESGLSAASGFDVLPAIDAIIAGQRAASGIAPLEVLAAALRADRGEAPRPVIDAEVTLALVDAIGKASRDPGLTDLAAALAASAARPEAPPAPIIVNPPPVTVHTPDVKVENHPPDVTVNAAGKPRGLRIVRDAAGNAESYEPIEDEQ